MSIEMGVDDYFRELAMRLIGTTHGEKSRLIEQAAQTFGLSPQNVYRRLRAAGWRSGRKLREDKADSRLSLDDARQIAGILDESTRRGNGKRLLGVADAMAIAQANQMIAPAGVSPATALRVLRLNGLHPEQLKRPSPHMPLASLHPNHVWQFDVSVCVLFYLDDGTLGTIDEKKFYKNKPDNLARIEKKRVLRYLITDHYSGALYVEYFLAAGENQETLFNFLMNAFFKRGHEQDPFHGVPRRLVWDAGSANQSYLIRNLLDQLDVAHYAHTPGNPRAKGQVEVHHNIVERKFEGRLPMMRITSLAQLNHHAHIWMREFNANFKHSRHGNSRYGLWQTIRREHLRVPRSREVCEQLLHTKPETRKVQGSLVVSYRIKGFETLDYSVVDVPGVRVGDAVEICVNPYRAPNIDVLLRDADGRITHIECEPLQKNAAGFRVDAPVIGQEFRAAPDTATEREKKNLVKLAYGAGTLKEAEAKRDAREPAFGGLDTTSYLEAQTRAHYMRRPGVDLDLPDRSRPEPTVLTHVQACKRLLILFGDAWSAEMADRVRAEFPEGVPEIEMDALAARLRNPAMPIAEESKIRIVK
jgi:hypothetical protein